MRSEGLQFPILAQMLNGRCLPPIRSYLEIGVSEGGSLLRVIAENPQLEDVVLCDNWSPTHGGSGRGGHAHIELLLSRIGFPLDNVTFLDGDSREMLNRYFTAHREKVFDLAFVDGDHTCMGLLGDLFDIRDRAMIIMVHDVQMRDHELMPDLRMLFYKFAQTEICRSKFIIIDDNNDLCGLIHRDWFGQCERHL
jgi:hypothetical protein